MTPQQFRKHAHQLVDWMADYYETVENFPVKSQVQPKDIYSLLPDSPPVEAEPFETVFADFKRDILKGITHWQHPSFFAYFPANSSLPSVLAEMLTATLGAQCMSWETSPAAAELEERMMNWLKQMMGLPDHFVGVIQDTASTATLASLLTAREKFSDGGINQRGFANEKFTVYCSTETHSSLEKAIKIAGFGKENLRKIAVDDQFAMQPSALEQAIREDLEKGYQPLCVTATVGTTSSTAVDPLFAIGEICQKYHLWFHVDAAFAGTAALLPEMRPYFRGLELADTYVFNPHKWMFTNFDCSAYFVKDKAALLRTFEILPEYLKTKADAQVNNYRDWGVPLGRRFRALKLWFVIRTFGVSGLQDRIREHVRLAHSLAEKMKAAKDYEILAPVPFSLICFRYKPAHLQDLTKLNELNARLLENINKTGQAYLTHTKLKDVYAIRLVIAQTYVSQKQVDAVWELIQEEVLKL